MSEQENQRDFTRVAIEVEADVGTNGSATIAARARDLSISGVFLASDDAPKLGTRVELTLFLGGRKGGVEIDIEGKVARTTDEGFAVRFTRIVGAESFEHLRNLVLYNAADRADDVHRELDEHLGLKPKDGTYDR